MIATFSYIGQPFYVGYQGNAIKKGDNTTRENFNGCCYGRHAEMSAIKKLPPLKDKKKKKVVNLLVIRVSCSGQLKNSRPCKKCIEKLQMIRGYKIKNVYYSTSDGTIVMVRFSNLINSNNQHVSRRFRNDQSNNK